MKINQKSLFSVVESRDYLEFHHYHTHKEIRNGFENFHLGFLKFMKIGLKHFRKLILSKKTKDNLVNYKVPKDIRFDVLRSLPNRMDAVLIDEKTLMRYHKTNSYITLVFDEQIDTRVVTKNCLIGLENDSVITTVPNEEIFMEKYYSLFMVVITYLELTPVTFNVIQSNKSFGIQKLGKIKNELKSDVIYVTTSWNVEKVHLSVSVRGHWRLQPCGEGRKSYKYVFIQPYEKGLVRRLPQKELV